MLDYFEHQPITDKWAECVTSAHPHTGMIEEILVRRKNGWLVFSGEQFTSKGFLHGLLDSYLPCCITMLCGSLINTF